MTEFRCTQCGATALPPPGAAGPLTCRHCGGTVVSAESSPTARAAAASARRQGRMGWLGVVLAIAGAGALLFGTRYLTGPPEGGAVVAGVGKVPLSKLAVPVRAQAAVTQRGRQVYLTLRMTDAQGKPIRSVYLSRGRTPGKPEVSIVDQQGAIVYQCRLSYG